MKAAIWGAGNIAQTHAEMLRSTGVPLEAIIDVNEEKAHEFAEKWNVPIWSSDPSVLFSHEITSVHVCTPPNLHYKMVRELLEAGKNVLCEKPLCFDSHEARELAKLATQRKLICAINLNVRYHLACQKAHTIVSSPEFGHVRLIHGNYLQEYHAFPAPEGWRYNEQLAGKMRAVTEIGTHWIDIAQFISGKKIKSVSALFACFQPTRYSENGLMYAKDGENRKQVNVNSEDSALVHIRFDDGVIGSMVLSEVSQGRVNCLNLEITGENENLWWNSEENNLLCTATKGCGVNNEIFAFGNGFADTFRALMSGYYADIASGKYMEHPAFPTLTDGADLVCICNAIYKSAQNNAEWVDIASI
ncbi:MAG: Gfo/Idh/MocA family oxidoreductase [Hydrogenoanaerobacterium sp.]